MYGMSAPSQEITRDFAMIGARDKKHFFTHSSFFKKSRYAPVTESDLFIERPTGDLEKGRYSHYNEHCDLLNEKIKKRIMRLLERLCFRVLP